MCMGSMSIWHWILVLGVALLLFGGRGKISELMGDFAKGIKSFKKGLMAVGTTEDTSALQAPNNIVCRLPPDQKPAPTATAAPRRGAGACWPWMRMGATACD